MCLAADNEATMDPLSLTANAIGVGGAVRKSIEAIRAFSKARSELQALGNEVSDLYIVLSEVEYLLVQVRQRPNI